MRIYIRHAEKAYQNGQSENLGHDPGLTILGRLSAQLLAKRLLETYGMPKWIICSPYLRCRETALEMVSVLNVIVPIKCDNTLAEYLGNRPTEELDVDSTTSIYTPPHPENFDDLDVRVRIHNDKMSTLDTSPEPIWFITHGIVLHRLANCLGYRLKRSLPYLATLIVGPSSECYTIQSCTNENDTTSDQLVILPRKK